MLITLVLIVVANVQFCAYGREIFDISHAYRDDMPVGDSAEGLGNPLKLIASMKNGSDYNFSEMKMIVHTGTHVDSPAHFYQEYYEAGLDVDTLDLYLLNGPALVVDVPRDTNITAKVMEGLNIPRGIQRVIFRTLNTDRAFYSQGRAIIFLEQQPWPYDPYWYNTLHPMYRRLMWKREFDSSFVGFMEDGAQWLVDNTRIKLVGIDYLSAAAYVHSTSAHLVFLKNKDIILVEGLKLDDVELGIYSLHCLPLRLLGAEGSPARCILIR
ncbi:cyclase-like protein 1 isoform X1 [Cryptomeria japonica]|uniref:cyclase-like protein 1 isoform X1 n=1 Tax=Cryptomeria japonica TaxID=3369 RepID=UPI0025AC419F|nr:cyclase-like protein 1 isoform X1 [Cryptomeria japonica]